MKNKPLEIRIEEEIKELNRGYEDYHTKEIIVPNEELLSGIEKMTGMNMIADIGYSYNVRWLRCCNSRQSRGNTFIYQHQAKQIGINCWDSKIKVCPQCAIVARSEELDEDTKELIRRYRKAYVNWSQGKYDYDMQLSRIALKVAKKQRKKLLMDEIESLSTFEEKAVYFVKHIMIKGIEGSGCEIHYTSDSISKLMMSHILTSEQHDDWGDAFDPECSYDHTEYNEWKKDQLENWLKPWLPSYMDNFNDDIQHMEHAKNEIVKMYMLDTDDPITLAHDWCEHEFWDYTYPTSECSYDAVMITVDSTDGPVNTCSAYGEECRGDA